MTAEYKLTLPAKTLENADPKAKVVLEKAKAQVGFIPNMYAGMANSPGLLETYLDGYHRFRKDSGFTPAEQEVVFLTVSRGNGCDYCMAAHSMLADQKSKVAPQVTEAAIQRAIDEALLPFERGDTGENPYMVQADLQDSMQALVGIVRLENEMQEALAQIAAFNERAAPSSSSSKLGQPQPLSNLDSLA